MCLFYFGMYNRMKSRRINRRNSRQMFLCTRLLQPRAMQLYWPRRFSCSCGHHRPSLVRVMPWPFYLLALTCIVMQRHVFILFWDVQQDESREYTEETSDGGFYVRGTYNHKLPKLKEKLCPWIKCLSLKFVKLPLTERHWKKKSKNCWSSSPLQNLTKNPSWYYGKVAQHVARSRAFCSFYKWLSNAKRVSLE